MSDPAPVENPYIAPEERYSPNLTTSERELLVGLLELRERPSLLRLFFRAVPSTVWTLPFAIAFGVLFAAASSFALGLSGWLTVWIGGVAFGAALAGSLFRDLVDATNTQSLLEVLNRITDFDEVGRILYDRQKLAQAKSSADEPRAAIPVDEDYPPARAANSER